MQGTLLAASTRREMPKKKNNNTGKKKGNGRTGPPGPGRPGPEPAAPDAAAEMCVGRELISRGFSSDDESSIEDLDERGHESAGPAAPDAAAGLFANLMELKGDLVPAERRADIAASVGIPGSPAPDLLEKLRAAMEDGKHAKTPEEEFLYAARDGDMPALQRSLDSGTDVNLQDNNNAPMGGTTALMMAAMKKHIPIVSFLLQAKADPHLKNNVGDTALDIVEHMRPPLGSSDDPHYTSIAALLRSGPQEPAEEPRGKLLNITVVPPAAGLSDKATPGCVVALSEGVGVVCAECGDCVSVEMRDATGQLKVVAVAREGLVVVQNSHGLPGWSNGDSGGACNDLAAAQGISWPYTIAELESRASFMMQMFGIRAAEAMIQRGLTPHFALCVACYQPGQESIVEELLRQPAVLALIDQPCDGTVDGFDNGPPLLLAAENGSLRLVNLLLEAGANVDVRAPDVNQVKPTNFNGGMTPLWRACELGRLAVVDLLLDWGASCDLGKTLPMNNPHCISLLRTVTCSAFLRWFGRLQT